jgi:predicted GIY-YIG superfamily endonuclease
MLYNYALKLKHKKYYIGSTTNPDLRLDQHMVGRGAIWTKIHKPLEQIELRSDCGIFDEDILTLEYMIKYGVENVRGGKFSQIKLPSNLKGEINRSIRHAQNLCLKCGSDKHFVSKCTQGELPQADLDLIQKIIDDDIIEVDEDPEFKRFNQRQYVRYHDYDDFEEYSDSEDSLEYLE